MEKAKQLADMMAIDFELSIGWLSRWKENENITFHTVQGEKAAAYVPGAEHWIQDILPIALEGYAKRDIYNADETGLFYKALPKGTFAVRGDKPTAGKQQKEKAAEKARLMALLLCNQDGSDKQVFVVGKAAKPRCFANIRRPPLPYYSNTKAWMLSGLWSQTMHPVTIDVKLTNIKVVFLPPNTTCLIQPLDQGIIHNLKVFYRQQLLQKQLIAIDKGESLGGFSKSITVLQALHMLKQALLLVKPEFIQNCFRKAAFPDDSCGNDYDNIRQQEDNMTSDCLPPALSIKEFTEWVSSDNDVAWYGDLTDAEIFAQAQHTDMCAEEDDDEEQEALCKPTRQEVLAALDTLRSYFDAEINEGLHDFYNVENRLIKHVQQKLTRQRFRNFFMITML
uniref:HTH CENPB-type domain-containing protein n=1 Tax=Plectus sambesii TaxID=2011161 RepID=A0A914XU35_9BILA